MDIYDILDRKAIEDMTEVDEVWILALFANSNPTGQGATPLNLLFVAQQLLMDRLDIPRGKVPITSTLFKDVLLNLMGEANEAVQPLAVGTKPWKQGAALEELEAHVEEEVIDVLFFLLEALILRGITPDQLLRRYFSKWLEVNRRIEGKSAISQARSTVEIGLNEEPLASDIENVHFDSLGNTPTLQAQGPALKKYTPPTLGKVFAEDDDSGEV